MLHVCVVPMENCSITYMTVSTESVFCIFSVHSGKSKGLCKVYFTHAECRPVSQVCAVVSFIFSVMKEGGRALISHILTRKGQGTMKVMHIMLLLSEGLGLEHTVPPETSCNGVHYM